MTLPILAILLLLLGVSIFETRVCIDDQYLACVNKTCGVDDNSPNISYPFFIQSQKEDFCGLPGYHLTCNARDQAILELYGFDYIVHDIFYQNQSLRVSNAVFSDDNVPCPLDKIENFTMHSTRRFDFASPNRTNLLFYSNCTHPLSENVKRYEVPGCHRSTDLAILENDLGKIDFHWKYCEKNVSVPVEWYGPEIGDDEDNIWEKYYEVAKRGFVLNYQRSQCGLCSESGGRCGTDLASNQFQCFCEDKPHSDTCKSSGSNKTKLKLALGIGLSLMVIMCSVLGILLYRYKRRYASSEYMSKGSSSDPNSRSYLDRGGAYFGVPVFSYCDLEEATHHFDSNKELGDGGFGTVYYGILKDGREVAVKRLYETNYKRVEQFMNEIQILTSLHHKNLVTLYGCTSRHSRELLLVYEYISNGTVADHLHGDRASPGSLTWPIRMSIALETANALSYLHASDIIHRDVKTNNILLDRYFCVKVADFGLSRLFPLDVTHVSTAPQGTPGYVDPEYHQCYQLTSKSDVYSFGVVLIELISSLPAVDISRHRHEINLSNLAINKIQNQAYNELVDPSLGFESDLKTKRMITNVAELAFQCLQNDKDMRPTMEEVLETLKGIESGTFGHPANMDVDDQVGILNSSVRPPPSPESDEVVLLKMQPPLSPMSVTDKWIVSTVTTPNTSS